MHALSEFGGWPGILGRLATGRDLDAAVTRAVMACILAGEASDSQIAAFIVGLQIKGATTDELSGMQESMLEVSSPLNLPHDTIDIVGMGGGASRRSHALNVSTMAAFVAAGAGAIVCKHGNRKASSTSGSFDLLEALGVPVDIDPATLEAHVAEVGVGFAFARTFHPSMRHVGPVRAQLGIPTVFNVLGPLAHPARLTRQVIGVAEWSLAPTMAGVLMATGSVRALIVHGQAGDPNDSGLDELTTAGRSRMLSIDHGRMSEVEVDATEFGLALVAESDLAGGDAATNARIARSVFAGERSAARDIVVLNAAAGLVVAGLAENLGEGVIQASAAIDDGRAEAKLSALVSRA